MTALKPQNSAILGFNTSLTICSVGKFRPQSLRKPEGLYIKYVLILKHIVGAEKLKFLAPQKQGF